MVETRRSSSSSKRPLSSPSPSPIPNGKRSKAAEASSSTNDTKFVLPAETLGPVKEFEEHGVRSSDPASDGDKKPSSKAAEAVEKTTPDVQVDGEPLVSPMTLG